MQIEDETEIFTRKCKIIDNFSVSKNLEIVNE